MKKKIILLVLAVILSTIAVAFALNNLGIIQPQRPEIVDIQLSWKEVTFETTKINAKVIIYNPNRIPISVKITGFEAYLNGIKMAWAEGDIEVQLFPEVDNDVYAILVVDNSKIQEVWVSHLQHDEASMMTAKLKLTILELPIEVSRPVETDILGEFKGIG